MTCRFLFLSMMVFFSASVLFGRTCHRSLDGFIEVFVLLDGSWLMVDQKCPPYSGCPPPGEVMVLGVE